MKKCLIKNQHIVEEKKIKIGVIDCKFLNLLIPKLRVSKSLMLWEKRILTFED